MRRVLVALVAIAMLAGLGAGAPGRAQASSGGNIPGAPLPSASVSGRLGGPIYDVVYSIDVPAARVLLISLSGSAGTDFDLYLFDSTAKDIYARPPVGLVARSTGPTSTETIKYPVIGGGRFYIDLSGATNVEGTYQLAVRIAADTTPPTVAMTLDGGAPATSETGVTATVVATDDLSGVSDMQLSGDGTTWTDWQPYASTAQWTFASGDGPKTLWVRVRDRAGNVSSIAHAVIRLDTSPPIVVSRLPDPGDPITSTRPTIRVTFSEAIRPASWTNFGLLLQDASGTVLYGTYGWDLLSNTGTFTPDSSLVPGAAYIVSLGGVVDPAGNPLVPIGTWVIRPMITPTATITVAPRVVPAGASVAISGEVVGGLGTPVVIERAVGAGPWEPFVTVFTGADGSFTTGAAVDANASFRADVPATAISAEALSAPARVLVRRDVVLGGVDPAVTRRVAASTRVSLVAVVTPSDPAVPVTLFVYRYAVGRGYVLQSSVTRTTVAGRYTFSWRPGRGSYYLRLTTPSTPLFANGISPTYRWVVY